MKTPLLITVLRRGLLLMVLAGLLCGLAARAQTPQYMTYQGYLTDQNGTPLATNGPANYSVAFRIWSQPTGTSGLLYGELQTVTVNNGYFSVLLGQGTTYNPGTPDPQPPLSTVFTTNTGVAPGRYVELTVKGINGGQDVTLLPRLQLIASPYAFLAAGANALVDGLSGANVISSSGNNVSVSGAVSATSFTGNSLSVSGAITANSFAGNGSGLTSLNAADLTGQVPAASLSGVALLASGNVFNEPQTINTSPNLAQAGLRLIAGAGNTSRATRLDFLNVPGSSSVPQWTMINDYNQTGVNDLRFVNDSEKSQMTLLQNGNVGIGTTTPGATLTIQQSIQRSEALRLSGTEYYAGNSDTQGISFLVGVNRSNNRQLWIADSTQVASPNSSNSVIRIMPDGSRIDSIGTDGVTSRPLYLGYNSTMILAANGYVGIGTASPKCPLDVESINNSIAIGVYEYLNGAGTGGPEGAQNVPMGIFSNSRIVTGYEFDAISDSRIKEVVGRSDTREDLATVRKLQITDYRKIDKVQYGGRLEKGVVAQEVEKIVPESVSTSTNFIPNIYALPTSFGYTNQMLSVALANPHGLVVGDRVKLIAETGVVTASVTAVPSAQSFVVAGVAQAPRQIFVFGKEVSDFRTVNYDRLFTTGLGAIQELAKRMDQVEAREAGLADLEQKAARVTVLEQQVSDLKTMVLQMAASSKATKLAGETPASGNPETGAGQRTRMTTASLAN
jgi:hypothetical protein